jgi:hypothetical protein
LPGGQITLSHVSGKHTPLLQMNPLSHGCSPGPHGFAQIPFTHVVPLGHAFGASMFPSQSLSTQSHTSGLGFTAPSHFSSFVTHTIVPALHGGWSCGLTGTSHGLPTSGLLSVQQLGLSSNTQCPPGPEHRSVVHTSLSKHCPSTLQQFAIVVFEHVFATTSHLSVVQRSVSAQSESVVQQPGLEATWHTPPGLGHVEAEHTLPLVQSWSVMQQP